MRQPIPIPRCKFKNAQLHSTKIVCDVINEFIIHCQFIETMIPSSELQTLFTFTKLKPETDALCVFRWTAKHVQRYNLRL